MWDWERYEDVNEVLISTGFEASGEIPMLDSHNRHTVGNILGSFRNIRAEDGKVVATATFSSLADEAFTKAREGHLKDASVGYHVMERIYVGDGETRNINGRDYSGPINVVTKWRLKEASLTAIGADEFAKARTERESMPNKNEAAPAVENKPEETKAETRETKLLVSEPADDVRAKLDAIEKRLESDKLAGEIRSLCQRYKVADKADEIVRDSKTKEEALQRILEAQANQQPRIGFRVDAGESSDEKLRDGLAYAVVSRSLQSVSPAAREKVLKEEPGAKYARDFSNLSLLKIAERSLESLGVETWRMGNHEIAQAVYSRETADLRLRHGAQGYHTTGDFPYMMLDATNKTLLAAYSEVQPTWRQVFRQGPSVPDFKQIHRVRLGEAPNLDVWSGSGVPEEVRIGDAKESYAVEAYANTLSFDWKSLVNDDLGGFMRSTQLLGAAAARSVNAAAWAVITANPAMSDGANLFSDVTGNRLNDNLVGSGGAAPSVATLAVGKKLLRLMVGLNKPDGTASQAILNIVPKFLVVPAALETTAEQLVNSIADPAASGNSGIYNPARSLMVVVEPLLDANSATAWYLFASTDQIDTVEVSFLQGQETPQISDTINELTKAQTFMVLQTFAAKAIDWRGCFKNIGT